MRLFVYIRVHLCMCVYMWRPVRVKKRQRNSPFAVRVQVIKDYQLLGIVCIQVGLDVVVLSVWEALDPLHIVFLNHPLEQVVSGRHGFCFNNHTFKLAVYVALETILHR